MAINRSVSIFMGIVAVFVAVADCLAYSTNISQTAPAVEMIDRVLMAWRHADARAIAELYEQNGDFVSPSGVHAIGRLAVEGFYHSAFANGYQGSDATAKILQARAISPDVTLIDGEWTIQPTAASRITQTESGLFVAIMQRRDGIWHIAALREQTSAKTFVSL